jgi:hypothetical protein
MAWWSDIIENYEARRKARDRKTPRLPGFSLGFKETIRSFLHENFVDFLYLSLSVFTYLYILLSFVTFVFQEHGPHLLAYTMETLSEPYLGALAMYVLVKEIELRRMGKDQTKKRGELFVTVWLAFLVVATTATYLFEAFALNEIYQTIVTNSLAAVIIRMGSLLR